MKALTDILLDLHPIEVIGDANITISFIQADSRKVESGVLFVALPGTIVDGHKFIQSAIDSGAVAVICETFPENMSENICWIKVASAHHAIGCAASAFYDYPSRQLTLIGITGTNGKTTIATLLFHLFRDLKQNVGLLSTVHNKINETVIPSTHTTPDPVALQALLAKMVDAGCEYCFMEVSSHAIHQQRIAGLEFDGGVFSNLTRDHLDYHGTMADYRDVKKSFFDQLPKTAFAITNADDKNGLVMIQNSKARSFSYSCKTMADYRCKILERHFEGTLLEINGSELWVSLIGDFNALNLLAVAAVGEQLGIEWNDLCVQLSTLSNVDGRLQVIRSVNNVTAIVDYAHTPDALSNVISTINNIREGKGKLITVVGAGGNRDKGKRPLMAQEAVLGSDKVILTSDNPRDEEPNDIIEEMFQGVKIIDKKKVLAITDRSQAIKTAMMMATVGDVILVAGKGHEIYQEIKGVKHHFDDREIVRETFDMLHLN